MTSFLRKGLLLWTTLQLAIVCTSGKKKCKDPRSLSFLIDSTNGTTVADFEIQRKFILDTAKLFNGKSLYLGAQVYFGTPSCFPFLTPAQGFKNVDSLGLQQKAIAALQYVPSTHPHKDECSVSLVNELQQASTLDSSQRFSVILAKYESVKHRVAAKEQEKFVVGKQYYLALLYASNPDGTSTELKAYAREAIDMEDLVPEIMKRICPRVFGSVSEHESLIPATDLLVGSSESMASEDSTTHVMIRSTELNSYSESSLSPSVHPSSLLMSSSSEYVPPSHIESSVSSINSAPHVSADSSSTNRMTQASFITTTLLLSAISSIAISPVGTSTATQVTSNITDINTFTVEPIVSPSFIDTSIKMVLPRDTSIGRDIDPSVRYTTIRSPSSSNVEDSSHASIEISTSIPYSDVALISFRTMSGESSDVNSTRVSRNLETSSFLTAPGNLTSSAAPQPSSPSISTLDIASSRNGTVTNTAVLVASSLGASFQTDTWIESTDVEEIDVTTMDSTLPWTYDVKLSTPVYSTHTDTRVASISNTLVAASPVTSLTSLSQTTRSNTNETQTSTSSATHAMTFAASTELESIFPTVSSFNTVQFSHSDVLSSINPAYSMALSASEWSTTVPMPPLTFSSDQSSVLKSSETDTVLASIYESIDSSVYGIATTSEVPRISIQTPSFSEIVTTSVPTIESNRSASASGFDASSISASSLEIVPIVSSVMMYASSISSAGVTATLHASNVSSIDVMYSNVLTASTVAVRSISSVSSIDLINNSDVSSVAQTIRTADRTSSAEGIVVHSSTLVSEPTASLTLTDVPAEISSSAITPAISVSEHVGKNVTLGTPVSTRKSESSMAFGGTVNMTLSASTAHVIATLSLSLKPTQMAVDSSSSMSIVTNTTSMTLDSMSTLVHHTEHFMNSSIPSATINLSPTFSPSVTLDLSNSSRLISSEIAPASSTRIFSVSSSVSVIVIPVWKKLEEEIQKFIEKPIEEENLNNNSWIEDFTANASSLLEKIDQTMPMKKSHKSPKKEPGNEVDFIEHVESVFLRIAGKLPVGESISMSNEKLTLTAKAVDTSSFDGFDFKPSKADEDAGIELKLPTSLFKLTSSAKAAIVAMSYKVLPAMNDVRNGFQPSADVLAVSVDPHVPAPLPENLSFSIPVSKNNYSSYKCAYWNSSDGSSPNGGWSEDGCFLISSNNSLVTCECNHMTSFAVLMQVHDIEVPREAEFALKIISYIGCGCSIAACFTLVLVYVMCGKLMKIDRNVIHVNLAIAIAVANILFLMADSVHKYEYVCLGVSVGMLYFYLAAFFWMFVEGIHVYLMVVKVFKSPKKMKVYLIVGWVLPAVIVAIATAKYHEYFTRDDFCWISIERGLIWSFVGPVLFIVLVNTIILCMTLKASYKMSIEESEFDKLRNIARLTLILMPIFGVTWMFGILAINEQLLLFQYVFTAVNAFQGVYIFICYCLLNKEVKREYSHVKMKSMYASHTSNGGMDTNSTGLSAGLQPYQRRRMKRSLSVEDTMSAVKLTKFQPTYPGHPSYAGYPSYIASYNGHAKTNGNDFQSTLTRNSRGWSVELLQLQVNEEGEPNDSDDMNSSSSLIPDSDKTTKQNGFLDEAVKADTISCTSDLDLSPVIRTFKIKDENRDSELTMTSYQV